MYKSTPFKKTARIIAWVCGVLFTAFSVLYLALMQPGQLATAQHLLSGGQTLYSPLWGTVIITAVLLLVRAAYRKTLAFPFRFHALYYFPSCLMLGLLTSIVPQGGWEVGMDTRWGLVIACICLYCVMAWVAMHFPDAKTGKQDLFSYLWSNLLLLALQFCMVGSVANTDDVYHYRLRAEEHIVEGQYQQALQVGRKSLHADRSLTAMRAFALSRTGGLGDNLFDYPQPYGSRGLLPEPSDTVYVHGWLQELYRHLGGRPGKRMPDDVVLFLERLAGLPSATDAVYDYLLCAYLLDKDLDAFISLLPRRYDLEGGLPQHYKEAVLLYRRLRTSPAVVYKDTAVEANLDDFLRFGTKFDDAVERSNQTRRMYGNTYWWYYYYQPLPVR